MKKVFIVFILALLVTSLASCKEKIGLPNNTYMLVEVSRFSDYPGVLHIYDDFTVSSNSNGMCGSYEIRNDIIKITLEGEETLNLVFMYDNIGFYLEIDDYIVYIYSIVALNWIDT